MSRISRVAAVLLAVGLSIPLAAERSSYDFEGHKFSLDLPPGYLLDADASRRPGFKTFGFATALRLDGTRGLIQVSLLDLSTAFPGER